MAHRSGRGGWLRAAVLGANDGLISTSSLLIGMAAAQAAREPVVLAGLAGLVAGALSMAAGEYVSVASQADAQNADLEEERRELELQPERERAGLAATYVRRGLTAQLSARDALGAHARDEIGITRAGRARPLQAALASAAAFSLGAAAPVVLVLLAPQSILVPIIYGATLALLGALGTIAAVLGGASWIKGAARVAFWGAAAMALTGLVGRLLGATAL